MSDSIISHRTILKLNIGVCLSYILAKSTNQIFFFLNMFKMICEYGNCGK